MSIEESLDQLIALGEVNGIRIIELVIDQHSYLSLSSSIRQKMYFYKGLPDFQEDHSKWVVINTPYGRVKVIKADK